jgi:hypothetical protein
LAREIKRMTFEATTTKHQTTLTATVQLRRPLEPKVFLETGTLAVLTSEIHKNIAGAIHTPSKTKAFMDRRSMGTGQRELDLKSSGSTDKYD